MNIQSLHHHLYNSCFVVVVEVVAFFILEQFEIMFDNEPKYQQAEKIGNADLIHRVEICACLK